MEVDSMKEREEVIVRSGLIINGWEIIKEVEKKGSARQALCKCLGCGKEYIRILGNIRRSTVGMCKACSIKKRCTTHGLD